MYKIVVNFKNGFRSNYEAKHYYDDENEIEIILSNEQIVLINKKETTIISITEVK